MLLRVLRAILPYLVGLVGPYIIFKCNLVPSGIEHYNDFMPATITLGAIGVGFLAASITLLPSFGNSGFITALKRIGAYRKLLKDLVSAILVLFIMSIFSVVGVFIGNGQYGSNLNMSHIAPLNRDLIYIWSYLFALVVIICGLVIRFFLRVLFMTADEE